MPKVAELPAGLLTVDACLIEEQPDHVVLAIRVPKATIGDNLPVLAALAEYGGPQTAINGRTANLRAFVNTAPRKKRASAVLMAVTGILAMGLMIGAEPSTANQRPPMVYYGVTNETPKVAEGGELVMVFLVHRKRVCKADIDRVIMKEGDPGEIVWRVRVSGLGVAVTSAPVNRRVRITIPDGLSPGFYIYKSTMFSDCGDGPLHTLDSPDIPFEVT